MRLECRGLEEVKSTVQARYTMTYIVYERMFVRHKHMTYPTRMILGMSHSIVRVNQRHRQG